MDFLGLRNLTVISDALENIKLNGKQDPIFTSAADDPATYCWAAVIPWAFSSFDGGGMRPSQADETDNFEDTSCGCALSPVLWVQIRTQTMRRARMGARRSPDPLLNSQSL